MTYQQGARYSYAAPEAYHIQLSGQGISLLTQISYLSTIIDEDLLVDDWDEEGEL